MEIIAIEKNFIIMIFAIWCILVFKLVALQLHKTFVFLLPVHSLSLEQRHRLIDGNFYNFIKLCEARVPERESMVFKVFPQEPDFRTPDWLLKEYFIGRLAYFLYPRKVLREKNITSEPKYIIIFDTNSRTLKINYR